MVEPQSSNFRVITTNCLGVQIFRKFMVYYAGLKKKVKVLRSQCSLMVSGWIWAAPWEILSLGSSDEVRLKLACSATEASMRLEILVTETRDITLSRQRTIKALIRLRGWAGWAAPLLFAYDIRCLFSWPGSFCLCRAGWVSPFRHYFVRYIHRIVHIFSPLSSIFFLPYPGSHEISPYRLQNG